MIEESVEGFVARWRTHPVRATAFARAEGSPLLELGIGDAVVQTLERTGPYLAPTGSVRVVLHAMTQAFDPAAEGERRLEEQNGPARFTWQVPATRCSSGRRDRRGTVSG